MSQYSIKDLEQLSGIKAHTIRIWEKRYGVLQPDRTLTNIRYYSDDQLKKLLNVSLMVGFGHKISKVSSWSDARLIQEIQKEYASNKSLEDQAISNKINSLIVAMIELNEEKFKKIFEISLSKRGFESTMTQVIYPFLDRVGIMWGISEINPAHEHFISHLIRQKIISTIDALESSLRPDYKSFLLFLPENEFHELGLLMANYMVRKSGHKVYYLGQHVPFSDVVSVVESVRPNYLISFVTTAFQKETNLQYLEKLSAELASAQLLISGRADLFEGQVLPNNVKHLPSIDALSRILA